MLLSMNWIRDFVNLDGLDLDDLIHRFTLSTAEVEDVYHIERGYEDLIGKLNQVGASIRRVELPDGDALQRAN